MNLDILYTINQRSLREKIKKYREIAAYLRRELSDNPDGWGQYQGDFNRELNNIFMEIMNFERARLAKKDEDSVYKLKRIFMEYLRDDFLYGDLAHWCVNQPYGYAGDFKLIDDVYVNKPTTTGFDRLFDNYALMTAVATAIRNRKEDIKKMIKSFYAKRKHKKCRIMNLACGPSREIMELIQEKFLNKDVAHIDCYDHEPAALEYAKTLIGSTNTFVKYICENAMKLALKNIDPGDKKLVKYDLIYSLGLFDYLDYRIASRLVSNLQKLLSDDGQLVIANVREKYQNPSVFFLEWVGDWNLIYRSEVDFKNIFTSAGIGQPNIDIKSEQQGIVQYAISSKAS